MTMTESLETTDADLQPIAPLCDGKVCRKQDGWRQLIYMPQLRFIAKGTERKMDALLCLNHNNPTYPTKIYFAENVGCGLNWNEQAYILGRNWHSFSWRDIHPNQSPIEILAAHLAPLN